MNTLPNDILDKIYFEKHKLELNELHLELKDYHSKAKIQKPNFYLFYETDTGTVYGSEYDSDGDECEVPNECDKCGWTSFSYSTYCCDGLGDGYYCYECVESAGFKVNESRITIWGFRRRVRQRWLDSEWSDSDDE